MDSWKPSRGWFKQSATRPRSCRLHRLNAQKDVIIYAYVDWQVPVLAKMHVRRRTGYKAIGYEIALPENKNQAVQLALENLCVCEQFYLA